MQSIAEERVRSYLKRSHQRGLDNAAVLVVDTRDMGYPTTGSLGSYLGVDQDVPILTIEFQQGQDEAAAASALEKGLAAVIRSASVAIR